MMRFSLLALWPGTLLACLGPVDPARARAALLAADRAFDSTVAARGLEGWVSFFGDSGQQIDRHGDFVIGPAAVRDHMRGLLTDSTRSLRWTPDHAEASADLTLGYTWGRWMLSVRDSAGSRAVGQGRYLTVWRKQRDGSWKVEADVGTDTSPD
jgi:ketosteroid isomerase-like protein